MLRTSAAGPCLSTVSFVALGPTVPTCTRSATRSAGDNVFDNNFSSSSAVGNVLASRYTSTVQRLYPTVAASPSQRDSNINGSSALRETAAKPENYHRKTQADRHSQVVPSSPTTFRGDSQRPQRAITSNVTNQAVAPSATGLYGLRPASCTAHNRFNFNASPRHLEQYAQEETHILRPQVWIPNGHRCEAYIDQQTFLASQSPPQQFLGMTQQPPNRQRSPLILHRGPNNMAGDHQLNRVIHQHAPGPQLLLHHPTQLQRGGPYYSQFREPASSRLDHYQSHEQATRRDTESAYEHYEQPYRGHEYHHQEYRSPLDLSGSTERFASAPGSHSFELQGHHELQHQDVMQQQAEEAHRFVPAQRSPDAPVAAATDVGPHVVQHPFPAPGSARGPPGSWATDSRGTAPAPVEPSPSRGDDAAAVAGTAFQTPYARQAVVERREVKAIQQSSEMGALLSLAALAEAACYESVTSDDGMGTTAEVHSPERGELAETDAVAPHQHEPTAPSSGEQAGSLAALALQSSNFDSLIKTRGPRARVSLDLGGGRGPGRVTQTGGAPRGSKSPAAGTGARLREGGGSQESLLRRRTQTEVKEEAKWGIGDSMVGGDGVANVNATGDDGLRLQSLLMAAAEAAAERGLERQQKQAQREPVGDMDVEAGQDGDSEAVSAAATANAVSGRGPTLPITVRRPLNGKPYVMKPTWRSRGDDNYLKLPPNLLKALTRQQRNGTEAVPVTIRFTSAAIIQPYGESCTTADEEDALECFVSRKGPGGCLALQVPVSWRMHGRRLLYTKLRQDMVLELGLGEILEEATTSPSDPHSWRALSRDATGDPLSEKNDEDEPSQDQTPPVKGATRAPRRCTTGKRADRRSPIGDDHDDQRKEEDAGLANATDGPGPHSKAAAAATAATTAGEDSAPKAKRRRSSTSTPFSPSPPRHDDGGASGSGGGAGGDRGAAGGAVEAAADEGAVQCSQPAEAVVGQPQQKPRRAATTRVAIVVATRTSARQQQRRAGKAGKLGGRSDSCERRQEDAVKSDMGNISKSELRAAEALLAEEEVSGQQVGGGAAGGAGPQPMQEPQLLPSIAPGAAGRVLGGVAAAAAASEAAVDVSEQELQDPLACQERIETQQQQQLWSEDQALQQQPQMHQQNFVHPAEHIITGTIAPTHSYHYRVQPLPSHFIRSRPPEGHMGVDVDAAETHGTERRQASLRQYQAVIVGPPAGQHLAEAARLSLHPTHPPVSPLMTMGRHAVARAGHGGPPASSTGPAAGAAGTYRPTVVANRAPEPPPPGPSASAAARNVVPARTSGDGSGVGEGPRDGLPHTATLTSAAAGAASAVLGRTWTLLEQMPDAQRAAARALSGPGRLQRLPPGLPPAEATAAINDFRGLLDSAVMLLYRAQEARQVAASAVTASVADIDLLAQRWQALGGQGGGRGAAATVAAEAGKVWRCLLDAATTLHWAVVCLLRLYGSFEVAAEEGWAVTYALQSRDNGTLVLTQVAEVLEPLMRPESGWLWV